jgi:hypothetical protein
VPVDLCNATNGRLHIQPDGTVIIEAQTFSNAQCFTSLESATYVQDPTTPLTLQNGWTDSPFSTRHVEVQNIGGIVVLQGAIATTGTNPVAFTLPAAFRPTTDVYVKVDLCGAANGRLFIHTDGVVTVQAQTAFSSAQCFTSLEGASFALDATGTTALTLKNGWTNAPFSTRNAAGKNIGGVVHLEGAIATSGTNPIAFTLPVAWRPTTDVYVPVDLCNANNGRLFIHTDGVVTVQAESAFSDAQCFTSLEGVSFAVNATGYTALTLQGGWTNAPFATRNAAVASISGVVHLEGAIATTGTNQLAFTLPATMRPTTDVYVAVDLCNATNGRLHVHTNGQVTVEAQTFANAQCFTSFEGASFAQ